MPLSIDRRKAIQSGMSVLGMGVSAEAAAQQTATTRSVKDAPISPRDKIKITKLEMILVRRRSELGARSFRRQRREAGRRLSLALSARQGGGKTMAILRSLVVSCELVKVDPFAWFRDLLSIGEQSIQKLDELLPHRWAAAAREYGNSPPRLTVDQVPRAGVHVILTVIHLELNRCRFAVVSDNVFDRVPHSFIGDRRDQPAMQRSVRN